MRPSVERDYEIDEGEPGSFRAQNVTVTIQGGLVLVEDIGWIHWFDPTATRGLDEIAHLGCDGNPIAFHPWIEDAIRMLIDVEITRLGDDEVSEIEAAIQKVEEEQAKPGWMPF